MSLSLIFLFILFEKDNIGQYISGCRRVGLNSAQLFNVSDLYEKKDLEAVCIILICLFV